MTVEEMLARISSAELTEWMAYEQLAGPLGGRRGDYHAAMVTSAVVNSQRGKGKAPIPLSKFLFEWGGRQRLTPEELYAKARQINAKLGGTERVDDDTD